MNENINYVSVECCLSIKIQTNDVTLPDFDALLKYYNAQTVSIESQEKLYKGLLLKIYFKLQNEEPEFTLYAHVEAQVENSDKYMVRALLDDA